MMTREELREAVLDLISIAPDRYTPDVWGGINFELAVKDALALEDAIIVGTPETPHAPSAEGFTPTGIV